MKKEKYILEGVLTEFAPVSYPGRVYGLYKWNSKSNRWIIDKKYAKKHGISLDNIK